MRLRAVDRSASADAMLLPFGEDIWIADGPTTAVAGFRYPTRMAIVRLPGNALFIWSPITLSDELRTAIDALGEVRFLIAPNSLHHLFLGEWRSAYPTAKLYAPPGLRTRRKDLQFEGDLGEVPAPEWSEHIDQVVMAPNLITTEVVFFHRKSRTAIFTDLIQHFDASAFTGWRAIVARLDLMVGPEAAVPRKFRAAFIDRRAARAAIQRILAWPTHGVLMAHATPVQSDGQAFLRRAFQWLKP